jgi:hypothetical protein
LKRKGKTNLGVDVDSVEVAVAEDMMGINHAPAERHVIVFPVDQIACLIDPR